jgi:predicted RNA-binding Zn-ribbon protein involved in translation (DUF1610 family)
MSNPPENGLPPADWYLDPNAPGLERWWNGVAWTDHARDKDVASHSSTGRPTASHSVHACPSCGAEDIKSLRAVREQGTSTGTASTSGWVQGSGNQPGQIATFSTRTKNYTDAARAAAAPKRRFNGVVVIVLGVVLAVVLSSIGNSLGAIGDLGNPGLNIAIAVVIGLVTMVMGVLLAISNSIYNRDVYPDARAQWAGSWQCQRCSTIFVL